MGIEYDSYQIKKNDLYDKYEFDSTVGDEAIIFCHGGAFRYGDKGDNSNFLAALSEKTSMRVYSIGYRNLDEAHSLKNMIDDISVIIDSIVKTDSISHFHIMGASSGAYLVWILSIMVSNAEKFNINYDFEVDSVTLISGYFLFKRDDLITQMFCLFPTFQSFPQEIKSVDMDYSSYNLPPIILITGEDDGCLEDSQVLYEAVKRSNSTEIKLSVLESSLKEKADHCFLIQIPNSEVAKQAFDQIYSFISGKVHEG